MAARTRTTTDHEQIRLWVIERGGLPAMVRRVGQPDEGELVFNFPDDGSDEPIIDISWSDFFRRFDDTGLALQYEDSDEGAELSQTYSLVQRSTVGQ